MFSKACEYAIRAVVFIASATDENSKAGIEDICSHIQAPRHFTAKILQKLSRQHLISSQKGVHGGFYLDGQQRAKTMKDVVLAIDGDQLFTGCGLGLRECSESRPCPMHNQFKSIRSSLNAMMEHVTIGELAARLKNGETVLTR